MKESKLPNKVNLPAIKVKEPIDDWNTSASDAICNAIESMQKVRSLVSNSTKLFSYYEGEIAMKPLKTNEDVGTPEERSISEFVMQWRREWGVLGVAIPMRKSCHWDLVQRIIKLLHSDQELTKFIENEEK